MTALQSITPEYFEPGHTFMAADAVRAAITKKHKSRGEVYDMDDFVQNMKNARKNLEVDVIDHRDTIEIQNDWKVSYPKGYT